MEVKGLLNSVIIMTLIKKNVKYTQLVINYKLNRPEPVLLINEDVVKVTLNTVIDN